MNEERVQQIEERLNLLESSTTIPRPVEQAFRQRLEIVKYAKLSSSAKNPSTETQAVSESGSASYSVAKPPDGFREFNAGGSILYIPYYT